MLFFTDSTSLYIYSAFLQANAAIIAVLGVFIVYKIQIHSSVIDIIITRLYHISQLRPNLVTNFELMNNKNKHDDFTSKNESDKTYLFYKSWLKHDDEIIRIKNLIILPLFVSVLLMSLDTIFLITSSNIHEYHQDLECYIAYIIGFLHIAFWILIGSRVKRVIIDEK